MTETISAYEQFFPASCTFETPRVILRLLEPEDYDQFLPLAAAKDTWTYFVKDLSDPHALQNWVYQALQERAQHKRMPFTIIDRDTRQVCGSTSFGNISFYDQRIEIGWSWLGPDYRGMGVNRHAKFALLSYAFEVMKMERVEVKTDSLNERAKAALLKVGLIPEGVLRSHMLMQHGRRRDSAYFSLLRSEWKERKESFFPDLL
ncbi:MAG: GNAT family protein [Candidatus Pseudobacter hemicellulosilyticus]|uniref:GNAT family protein n=1 Tax=Candidatus Pseudobacter hemicellulosilyticus TaxID=3121375 RepID=A0AAJ6BIX5_9BACT|nr:MAG: GNAT family protein [Pseudobacter sp.]